MNRKGFTLIELLGVIVLLGIIMVVAASNLMGSYRKSKVRNEEIFLNRLSNVIDSYVTLNSDSINFSYFNEKEKQNDSIKVKIYKGNVPVQALIDDGLISVGDYVNSGNVNVSCNRTADIEVYRDSDYVYCHRLKVSSLRCLSDNYLRAYSLENDSYAIDTCLWRD